MTTWARVENNSVTVYPYGVPELKAEYPHTSFPTDPLRVPHIRDEYGAVVVEEVAKPSFDARTQRVVEGTPVEDGGVWSQGWVVQAKTAEEISADEANRWVGVRNDRNTLLSGSDWRDLPGYPGADQEGWRTYRQELRDLPSGLSTIEDVDNVTYPTKP